MVVAHWVGGLRPLSGSYPRSHHNFSRSAMSQFCSNLFASCGRETRQGFCWGVAGGFFAELLGPAYSNADHASLDRHGCHNPERRNIGYCLSEMGRD
jgi:hypothetical protein